MRRLAKLAAPALLAWLALLSPQSAPAQMIGARAAAEAPPEAAAPMLDRDAVESYITIEGSVEKRIDPTSLRIVFALLVEGQTAADCQQERRRREEAFLQSLQEAGVAREAIVVDFISILPTYEWSVESREGQAVAVEKRTGFQMQSNVHVQVPSDEAAQQALDAAFQAGVSDVIAFDYWNDQIESHKKEARKAALAAAKEKAEVLLEAAFDERPRPINVQEWTRAVYPRSLYASFESAYAQQLSRSFSRGDLPRIESAKPKNTYYRGFLAETDVPGEGLPLRPQISVISTVRLYYAAPGSQERKEELDKPKE